MSGGLSAFSVYVEGLDHPEGVAVGPSGDLYAGGEAGQVYHVDRQTRKVEQLAGTGGFILGITLDADENVYACDPGRRQVVRVDARTRAVEVFCDGAPGRPLVNPNWSAFDDAGNLYLTDSGSWHGDDGCILRANRAGNAEVWSTEPSNFPNGCCLDADGSSLLVLESCTPALVRLPILPDGTAGARELVTMLPGTVPDGVSLDRAGTAYVCCYRPDRILTVSAEGEVAILADDPEGTLLSAPTNSAWMGPSADTLVCGNLGRWHLSAARLDAVGLPLRYPRG
ncbi:MAG: hypothetical protein NVSMB17_04320 [Candidatus Dormibacteria bacterium]